ncbi:MAG: protein-L-isoaspartate(D-aspartate) O-methyltransferase [Crocinitomicaceae bacterium]|nr:protein-L-isoaspartate(D-aspartate) O-methyltransferase [Crocinitomicaceae bacterium]
MLTDTYRHKGLRKKLAQELAKSGITDQRVLDAVNKVPRHYFLSSAFLEFAYENKAFQIGAGQTISAPYTVATQSQLLKLKPGMKVLEIGTGSGYQTCILCEMGAKVYSIERQKSLHNNAKTLLASMGYKAHLIYGDGYKGLPAFSPFDRIIVTCAVPRVPEDLLMQLRPGGFLVMPYGEGEVQEMMVVTESEDGNFTSEIFGKFSFVPMLEKRNSAR